MSASERRGTVEIDYVDHLTLLAFQGPDLSEVVGGAQYIREGTALARRGRDVGLGRAAGARARLDPHRPPRRGRARERHRVLLRRRAPREPQDGSGLSWHRIPDPDPCASRLDRGGVPDDEHRGDDRAVRGSRAARGCKRGAPRARGPVGCRDRRISRSDDDRWAAAAKSDHAAVYGRRVSGQSDEQPRCRGSSRTRT